MAKTVLTQAGFDKLVEELDRLMKVDLPDVIKRVAEARANGDLKENAEYHAARERQGHIQDRVRYLETTIGSAQVIEKNEETDAIVFGSKVTMVEVDDDDEEVYTLVGQDEADPAEGMISVTSPIGKALLGKKKGDQVEVETPGGTIEFEILEVE